MSGLAGSGMLMNPGVVLGLVVLAIMATALTNWLVRRLGPPPAGPSATLVAHLVWILLLSAAGLIAARYIERVTHAIVGYLLFGLVALGLSLVRAILYRRTGSQPAADGWPLVLHTLTCGLFALVVYLLIALLARGSADPWLFIPLFVGTLLPDLDPLTSTEKRWEHRGAWHTPAVNLGVAAVTAPLIPLIGSEGWKAISLGFFCHLVMDLFSQQGIMLLWPFRHTRYCLFPLFESPGCVAGRWVTAGLAVVALLLLLMVDLGPPPPAPWPSYEQSLERFHSLQGRNLVSADVEGTWQATGRRVNARFEVLNAVGQSFILLDRYSGTVFSAGRTASDNFYLDRIAIVAGAPAQIRPVELHLQDETLAAALPLLYQMQREPGVQHIFISGDLVLAAGQGSALQPDYALTRLPKIQKVAEGNAPTYRLQYLTAGELIPQAHLRVEVADLVIVATYVRPASGPTATALPSPPPSTPEAEP